jgi:hypothetical protein
MNFDNLKNSFQSLSYNEADNTIDFTRKIQGIVEQVRKEDQKDKQRIIGVSILAAGYGLVYALMGVVKYLENKQGTDHWAFFIYVGAIICFVPILVSEHRKKRRIKYDVPLMEFIENVEKRFALFKAKDILIIPGFIVLGISMYFFIAKAGLSRLETILIALVILVGAATVGFLVRLVVWRKKLILRDELRRIKESLQ